MRWRSTPLQGFSPSQPLQKARAGWAEAAAAFAPEVLLDDTISTKFDDEEWEW